MNEIEQSTRKIHTAIQAAHQCSLKDGTPTILVGVSLMHSCPLCPSHYREGCWDHMRTKQLSSVNVLIVSRARRFPRWNFFGLVSSFKEGYLLAIKEMSSLTSFSLQAVQHWSLHKLTGLYSLLWFLLAKLLDLRRWGSLPGLNRSMACRWSSGWVTAHL